MPKGDLMSLRCYETMFIAKPTLSDEEKEQIVENVKNAVVQNGGEVVAVDNIGVRTLSYPINKFERGHYYIIYYKAPGNTVIELERQMRYNEELLRFMTVKYETKRDIKRFEEMAKNVQ